MALSGRNGSWGENNLAEKIKDHREGHRQRLREKFWDYGLDKMTDAEVLELLLSFGTPRRDCKLTARAMLEKFGTIRDVFEATREELATVAGAGPANVVAVKLIHAVSGKYLEKRLIQRDYIASSAQVLEYLRHDLENSDKEVFKLIHINSDNKVLAVEDVSHGSISEAYVHAREVLERAIGLKSSSLVFVHNHPSGCPEPSEEDQRLTRRLVHLAYLAEMTVMDHIILGHGGDYFSFRDRGMISLYEQEVRETYRLKPRPGGGLMHEINASTYYSKKVRKAGQARKADSEAVTASEGPARWQNTDCSAFIKSKKD